jgi:hypothetical protein
VKVIVPKSGLQHVLFIGAKSLADSLEELRNLNDGRFTGLDFELRKEDSSPFAKYEIRRTIR